MIENALSHKSFLNLDHVTKNYHDPSSNIHFQALRGIDLKLKKGSLSSIIGPSGAGKSSLLNIISGIVKPSTGRVTVNGITLNALSPKELIHYRTQFLGILWQFPEKNLLPKLSAYENVIYSMQVAGYPRYKRKERAMAVLTSVGLKNRKDHKLDQLSGGEAQRAGLAVALANEPLLLLADEPTGELDTETTLEIIDYLKEINREENVTMIVVTHDPRFEKLSSQSYQILDGSIAGVRRTINSSQFEGSQKYLTTEERIEQLDAIVQREVSHINQFGFVKIPDYIRTKYNFQNLAQFVEDEGRQQVIIRPVTEEEDQ